MDPVSCNLAYMFVQMLCDSLNEYSYSADLAGLKWELSNSKYGMIVSTTFKHQIQLLIRCFE